MRLLLAAAFAMLAPFPAMAQQWHRVSDDGNLRAYVDLDSVRTQDGMVLATELIVYRNGLEDTPLKWGRTSAEYDCKDRKAHFLSFEAFDARNESIGKLEDPDEGEWKISDPGSAGELALTFICNISRSHAVRVADPLTDWEKDPRGRQK